MGSDVRLAGPAELHPPKDVVDLAHKLAEHTGARITITDDPRGRRQGRFHHTDVWVSMGEPRTSGRSESGCWPPIRSMPLLEDP
jgi:ornithine carbamoyltransferase